MPAKSAKRSKATQSEATGTAAAKAGNPDSRECPRYSFRGRAKAVILPPAPDGLAEEWEVVTTDISRAGVSILHRKSLAQGQQAILVLSGAQRFVEVCWSCQVWEGLHAAGCRFLEAPSESALAYLVAADG
jgi:hypothetical protein